MKVIKKIFGETNLTWEFLIIFSIVIALAVGILNRIPCLNNTSFQDIAIWPEMWFILAIFVIVNCKSCKEAVVKCFIFFLISQPLIYFTEVIIDTLVYNADFAKTFILYFKNYYIGAGWLFRTFLTIPGAFIAYQIKKDNILSALVLSVATIYLSVVGTVGLKNIIIKHSLNHLLNSVICLSMAYILIFAILKNKRERIIATILTSIGVVVGIVMLINLGEKPIQSYEMIDFDVETQIVDYTVDDPNIATVEIGDEGYYIIIYSGQKLGTTQVKVFDDKGTQYTYTVKADRNNFDVLSD